MKRENVDDKVTREKGHSNNEMEDEEDESIMLVYGNMEERSSDQTLAVQQRLELISKKMVAVHLEDSTCVSRLWLMLKTRQTGCGLWSFLKKTLGCNLGLVEVVKEKLPLVKHRQCAKHEYANFKKVYNGIDYKRHFWAASMATIKSYFIGTMYELKEMNGSAYDHLMARNLEKEIGMYVMERFYRMSTKHLTLREDVCPAILENLELWCSYMRLLTNMHRINYMLWSVVASETQVFKVRIGFESFQVDLGEQFYTCRLLEISGIPCVHACVAIRHTQQQPDTLINPWFVETYKGNIINGSKMWVRKPYAKPLPPSSRRIPGRPKTKRTKHVTEKYGKYKRGKTKASQYVKGVHEGIHMDIKDEGMHDVILVEDFKGDEHARQLLASRYS
uniref:SWIM-type domain-containing protein n=1 Tax=Lactuca sativa TaxID=4236 RepID=A0A9R1VRB2_LACSA|nr:hypothetical protein LSAT_V11C400207590 [Lactuca sativa]